MTGPTAPDQDILRRIIFQLQHPDWHLRAPTDGADGNAVSDARQTKLAAACSRLDVAAVPIIRCG